MILADTLRSLRRRWYIVLPGLVIALFVGFGSWLLVPPGYQRVASVLLLPGGGIVPENSPNPYLYLGSLREPADALVRVVDSQEGTGDVVDSYPGTEIEIARDLTTAGPIIDLTVTARTDQVAELVLRELTDRADATLERLQVEQNVAPQNRMTMVVLAMDERSSIKQRDRLVLTVGSAGGVMLGALLIASGVEGFSVRRRTSNASTAPEEAEGPGSMAQTRPTHGQ